MQEAEYPQRKGVKKDCGSHSFISYREKALLFPFKMQKNFIGTHSPKQQDEVYLHTTISKHEKQTRGASVLP